MDKTNNYIKNEYIDSTGPVRLSKNKEHELQQKAKRVLALVDRGYKNLVFPDIIKIKTQLIENLV